MGEPEDWRGMACYSARDGHGVLLARVDRQNGDMGVMTMPHCTADPPMQHAGQAKPAEAEFLYASSHAPGIALS